MFWIFDSFAFTIERSWQHKILVFWVLIGIGIAITLALSLPLYVDSVYTDILNQRLLDPPYAFRFRYLGAWNGNINQDNLNDTNALINDNFVSQIGLATKSTITYFRAGTWNARKQVDNQSVGTFAFSTVSGWDDYIHISQGQWPSEILLEEDITPIMLSEQMLWLKGIQVGDDLVLQKSGAPPISARVVAMWRPLNENDPSWIFPPKFFDEVAIVPQDYFNKNIESLTNPIDEAAWYLNFDGTTVRTSDVNSILSGIKSGQALVEQVLPGLRIELSPQAGLEAFNKEVNQVSQQLFIVIMPVGALVLYFVSLVSTLLVRRQQAEDVKLRSRGFSRWRMLGIHFTMWGLLISLALVGAMFFAPLVVELVGRTASFLRFDGTSSVDEVVFTLDAVLIGLATGLIAASSGLWMAWRTTRQNINSYRQNITGGKRPLWQRAYLDFMIIIPALYVLFTLYQQGGIASNVDQPFSDPLIFLAPTLFALGLTLLFIRFWPLLLSLLSGLMSYTSSMTLLMALREFTRSIGRYQGALLMMAFTLSLTGFTASMASTLDKSLIDSVNYRIGSDLTIRTVSDAQTEVDASGGQTTFTIVGYNSPPVNELIVLDGIHNVSRVGRYTGRIDLPGRRVEGIILGIDRAAIADTTFFRSDYADEQFASIFNKLAGIRTGIIVSRPLMEAYNLALGQEVSIGLNVLNEWFEARVPIVDVVDYFPTLDPNNGFFIITNLDPLFEMAGTPLPHDVWLSLDADADIEAIRQSILDIQFPVSRWQDPISAVESAQAEPSRRGILGFLSVGFVASIVLTLIGTIIQNTASFREQSTQLGTLRAMGFGSGSVAAYIIILQSLTAFGGVLSGTLIGVATTLLYLPMLDFSGGLPPYLVRVAWNEIALVYGVFAGILLLVTLFTSLVLSQEQITSVVKLGDA